VGARRLPPSPEPRHLLAWTAVLGGAAALGLLTFDAAHRQALLVSMVAALLALSVVVVTGYSGQISLAQLAIAGVAGFLSIRMVEEGWPFLVALVAATLVAVLLGILIGLPATRVRGMTLAVATLAMALAVEELVLASSALSGGAAGVAVPRPDLLGWDIGVSAPGVDNYRPQWGFVVLAVLVGACLVVANLRRNPTGLRWLAVRANERAAASAGIDVTRAKLGAFAVSSGIAGLAGVLLVFSATSVSRTSFMVIGALVALALTYLGGVSAIAGALVAGALASSGIVTTLLDGGQEGKASTYSYAVSGLALIVVAIVAPEGIAGVVRRQLARLRR
jgi:ABC-type branched-subunit amino acid transport system permease subunit